MKKGVKFETFILILLINILFFSLFVFAQETDPLNNPKLKQQYEDLIKNFESNPGGFSYERFLGDAYDDSVRQYVLRKNLDKTIDWINKLPPLKRRMLLQEYGKEILEGNKGIDFEKKLDLYKATRVQDGVKVVTDDNYDKELEKLFIEEFKKLKPEKQAEYFYDNDKNGKPYLDNTLMDKLISKLTKEEQAELTKKIANRAFGVLYVSGSGFTPEIKSVSLDTSTSKLKWERDLSSNLKLVNEKGGYINFGSTLRNEEGKKIHQDDEINSRIIGIGFKDGKFSLDMDSGVTYKYDQGTLGSFYQIFGKDGKMVGGKRNLNLFYGVVDKSKGERSIRELVYILCIIL